MKYEVTGNIQGLKRGDVVEFDEGKLPRAYNGRVRKLPENLKPKTAQAESKGK